MAMHSCQPLRPSVAAVSEASARDCEGDAARLISERDAARQALSEAQHASSRMIANLSHELRTPLNAIVGFSDLMRSGALGQIQPAVYRDYVEAMHQAGLHLVDLLNAVLDMARIGAREMPLQDSVIDPRKLAQDVCDMLRASARSRGLRLICRIARTATLRADERMVRQMLINLVSNAIKFGPASSMVTVVGRVEKSGGFTFEVRDQGNGLTEEQIAAILHPFRQLATDKAAPWHGTGLGLPLVRAMAELHDGTFTLSSVPGSGTRAAISLPSARVGEAGTEGQGEFRFTRSLGLQ